MGSNEQQNPDEWLRSLGEKFQKIRLGGGVVGKTTQAMLSLAAIWLAVVIRLSTDVLMDVFLLVAAILASAGIVWWIKKSHAFAEKHPLQAMLSGAQFIEYQRFAAQAKGLPNPGGDTLIAAPNLPPVPSSDPQQKDQ